MRKLGITYSDVTAHALMNEFYRSEEALYIHRLHAVLLVERGMSCREVSDLLGDSVRTVQYWVSRFNILGLRALSDAERPGRPKRLSKEHLDRIVQALRDTPNQAGMSAKRWDGKTLSAFILKEWDIVLGVRQCQRLLRQL